MTPATAPGRATRHHRENDVATVVVLSGGDGGQLRRVLTLAGHEVIAVDSLAGLAEAVRVGPVDVVVVEPSARVDMPVPELVRTITRDPLFAALEVVPVLRRGDLADRVRSLWYGAANVIELPLRDAELLAGVAAACRRVRRRASAPSAP